MKIKTDVIMDYYRGFIFRRLLDDFPRHPAQLYESFRYLVIFGILIFVYLNSNKKQKLDFKQCRFFLNNLI